jgi:hypothetical protein
MRAEIRRLQPNIVCLAIGIVSLAVLAPQSVAQWPDHATPNVPRTPDGEPDLTAPVPRTPWGTPDLSGIWQSRRGPGREGPEQPAEGPPLATFFDAGSNFEDGLPFTDWAREVRAERVANNQKDNPDAHCLPMGFLQFHLHPQPRKIIQTPDVTVILYEGNYGVRQIFTDGRPLPDNDPLPWWYGYSVGRWEGDTLVVDTIGLRDGGWLDVYGSPFTDEARVIERFTRVNYGTMNIDVTVEDPRSYTEPFTVRVVHQVMLDTDLIEFVCLENEQSSQYYDP